MIDWLIRLIFRPVFVVEIKDGTATGRSNAIPGGFLGGFSESP
jgi:hypothetical protein